MATNFFRGLHQLCNNGNGNWKITVLSTDGIMKVSVLPFCDAVNNDIVKQLPPMNLRGTPQELDEKFFTEIQKPVEKTVGLLTNIQAYEKALETIKAKVEADKKEKAEKQGGEKNKRYLVQMKKVEELEARKKIGEAIGQLPKAADFPEHADEIKKKHDELRAQHASLSLFEENQ